MSEHKNTEVVKLPEGISFNQAMTDLSGDPIKTDEEGGELRLGDVCVNALMAASDDKSEDGTQRLIRFNLAVKIKGAADDEEFPTLRLKDKQVKMVLDLVAKVYPSPLIYARTYEAIKGHTDDIDED
jgi:hypothetical protein